MVKILKKFKASNKSPNLYLSGPGVPPGVVNVIHGQHDAVNFICDHPDIRAISFVGGDVAGKHIHSRGTANGKRVQSNMGAKNHGVSMR